MMPAILSSSIFFLILPFHAAGVVVSFTAYNSHSIYGYQWGNDKSSFVSTVGWDDPDGNGQLLSWMSLVECFPDWRRTNNKRRAENYGSWVCDDLFGDRWRNPQNSGIIDPKGNTVPLLPCGSDADEPVYYFLRDVEGSDMGIHGDGYISCHMEETNYGPRRILTFPEGYFAVSFGMERSLKSLNDLLNARLSTLHLFYSMTFRYGCLL